MALQHTKPWNFTENIKQIAKSSQELRILYVPRFNYEVTICN